MNFLKVKFKEDSLEVYLFYSGYLVCWLDGWLIAGH